ncbi:MAG: YhbY family RNA-binding protein [Candidatus Lokiarchaeota archaeon]|jgi:RNA-binding protein YhbY
MDYQNEYKRALLSPPHCNLGKKGVSDEFVTHVAKLLKKYKIIKIKVLKSAIIESNFKELSEQIVNATNSYLLDIRGKTILISKIKPIN